MRAVAEKSDTEPTSITLLRRILGGWSIYCYDKSDFVQTGKPLASLQDFPSRFDASLCVGTIPPHPHSLAALIMPTTLLAALSACLLAATPCAAQLTGGSMTNIHDWQGSQANQFFGDAVGAAGDVNADGYDDVIIGSRNRAVGGFNSAGSAYVYSGLDGTLLHQFDGTSFLHSMGSAVNGIGDINGDGFDDVAVGANGLSVGGTLFSGAVYAYSGADGSLLHQWIGNNGGSYGASVDGVGDQNGDGVPDILFGASTASPGGVNRAGSVFLHSGADGSLLRQWDGTSPLGFLGASVAGTADIDGDGVAEILFGSPVYQTAPGSAFLYSGNNGPLLHEWTGVQNNDEFGRSVAALSDVNGDGTPDILIGATYATFAGVASCGTASIYSGSTGALLEQFGGQEPSDAFGSSLSSAGDLDQDGSCDILVGAAGANHGGINDAGSVFIFSGATRALLYEKHGVGDLDQLGHAVALAGDVNGDSFQDFLVGAITASPGGIQTAGTATVIGRDPYLRLSATSMSASVTNSLDLDFDFPTEAAQFRYRTLVSGTGVGPFRYGVDIPLTLDSAMVTSYYGIYGVSSSMNLHGFLDINGNGAANLVAQGNDLNPFVGRTLWLAVLANQPGSLPGYCSAAIGIEVNP